MNTILILALGCCYLTAGQHLHYPTTHPSEATSHETIPQYSYSYRVDDGLTGDSKGQTETRTGDQVRGLYSVSDPDGTRRVVEYSVDAGSGFNAIVTRSHSIYGTNSRGLFRQSDYDTEVVDAIGIEQPQGPFSQSEAPQPITPQPIAPQPIAPQPIAPQPITPQPIAPQPIAAQPIAPQPIAPQPIASQPIFPHPISPQPISPQPIGGAIYPAGTRPLSPNSRMAHSAIYNPIFRRLFGATSGISNMQFSSLQAPVITQGYAIQNEIRNRNNPEYLPNTYFNTESYGSTESDEASDHSINYQSTGNYLSTMRSSDMPRNQINVMRNFQYSDENRGAMHNDRVNNVVENAGQRQNERTEQIGTIGRTSPTRYSAQTRMTASEYDRNQQGYSRMNQNEGEGSPIMTSPVSQESATRYHPSLRHYQSSGSSYQNFGSRMSQESRNRISTTSDLSNDNEFNNNEFRYQDQQVTPQSFLTSSAELNGQGDGPSSHVEYSSNRRNEDGSGYSVSTEYSVRHTTASPFPFNRQEGMSFREPASEQDVNRFHHHQGISSAFGQRNSNEFM